MNLMPFDELNVFTEMVKDYKQQPHTLREKERLYADIEDYIEWLLVEAYVYGNVQAVYDLRLDADPATLVDKTAMFAEINREIAGKTYKQRIQEYLDEENSTVEDFLRVAETDMTRVYNAGVLNGADKSGLVGVPGGTSGTSGISTANGIGGVKKRWITIRDDRVRETHDYLEGMIVPYNEDFYTYDGDHARAPGLFSLPENNINCRCTLELIK